MAAVTLSALPQVGSLMPAFTPLTMVFAAWFDSVIIPQFDADLPVEV